MAYETLEETRQWLKEQEEKEGIKYEYVSFQDCLKHSNSGECKLADYEAMAKKLHENFNDYADKVDKALAEDNSLLDENAGLGKNVP